MASKVSDLLDRADAFLADAQSDAVSSLIEELTERLREYHPIVNPPAPATENPNVTARRHLVADGLIAAMAELQAALGSHVKVVGSTNIRRTVMKDGGVKAKLGIKFEAKASYNRNIDPIKVIRRHINATMDQNGLAPTAVIITSGSQMRFNARIFIEGDEDYGRWVRIDRL